MKNTFTSIAIILLLVACSGPDLLPSESDSDAAATGAPEGMMGDDDDDDSSGYPSDDIAESAVCAENYVGMAARAFLAYQWLANTFVLRIQNNVSVGSGSKTGIHILQSDGCPTVSNDGDSEFVINFGAGCYIGRDLYAGGLYAGYQTDIDTLYADGLISNLRIGNEKLSFEVIGNLGFEIGNDGVVEFESIVKLDLPEGYGTIDQIKINTEQQWQQVVGASSVETYINGLADMDVGSLNFQIVASSVLFDSRCYFPIGGRLDIGDSAITFAAASCNSGLVTLTANETAVTASIYQQFYSTTIGQACASGYESCIDDCDTSDCLDICINAYCSDVIENTCDMAADECATGCASTDPFSSTCTKACDNAWRTCCGDEPDCSCND